MTTSIAPESDSDPEIPPTGKRKAKRGFGGYLGGFAVLLVLVAACGGNSGTTTPTDSASSTSADITATASTDPSPADSSPSTAPAAPTTTTAVDTAPAYSPPAPEPTTQAPQPAQTTAQAQSCYPLTNGGNCYRPGEYCRTSDRGTSGIDANGDAIKCEDVNGWRWERV